MSQPLPDDAGRAWALMMRAFPGSFPPRDFDGLTLERYGEAYALAVEELEAQEAAWRRAHGD